MTLSLPGQHSTLEILRNGIWSFSKGFADSLRGAIELFFLDYKRAQQREQKLQQREIDRELLLNRNSPVREVQNIAKVIIYKLSGWSVIIKVVTLIRGGLSRGGRRRGCGM